MQNKSIVCVSENLDLLEALNTYFKEYQFTGFDSSTLALQDIITQQHIPDVIFLEFDDDKVPLFCEGLRKETALSLIPILLIIPEHIKQDPSQTLAMGASDFIHSPLKPDQVMAVLQKHIQTRQKWWDIYHIDIPQESPSLDNALNQARKLSHSTQGIDPPKEVVPRDFNHFKEYLLDTVKLEQFRRKTLQNYTSTQIYEMGEACYLDSLKVADHLSHFLSLELLVSFRNYELLPGAVPIQFCRKNMLLPLRNKHNQLFIAVSNPFQLEVLDILNQIFKNYVLLLAPPELIEAELDPSYRKSEAYREWNVRNAIRLNTVEQDAEGTIPSQIFTNTYPPHRPPIQVDHFPTESELIHTEETSDSQAQESQNQLDYFYHGTGSEEHAVQPHKTTHELSFEPTLETHSEEKLNRAYQAYRDQNEVYFTAENNDELHQTLKYTNDPEDAPIIHLVNSLIEKAHALQASDIHIEPRENEVIIRYRIDGYLHIMNHLKPQAIIRPIITRLKIMSQMDVGERRRPQDGRIHFSHYNPEVDIELRVSLVPLKFGEKAVLRLLDATHNLKALNEMGFSKQALDSYRKKLSAPHGMILHVGPTGSGKTTTLYAALGELNKPNINIQTIENPVEYNMPGINQLEIRHDIGLGFPQALRAYLRQDPDIILVGEIRDEETAHVALEAAMTGHLLLSTLHTNDAASTLIRLMEMGIKPYILSSSILLICAQRLLRKLCEECKFPYAADDERKELLGQSAQPDLILYTATGCAHCNHSGYRGRIGVYELLVPNQSIRQAMNIKGITPEYLKEIAIRDSQMQTLYQAGVDKVLEGLTSVEEIMLKLLPDEDQPQGKDRSQIYLPLPIKS